MDFQRDMVHLTIQLKLVQNETSELFYVPNIQMHTLKFLREQIVILRCVFLVGWYSWFFHLIFQHFYNNDNGDDDDARDKLGNILQAYISGQPMDRKLNDKLCYNIHLSFSKYSSADIILYSLVVFKKLLILCDIVYWDMLPLQQKHFTSEKGQTFSSHVLMNRALQTGDKTQKPARSIGNP